jgi:hypothetical protein
MRWLLGLFLACFISAAPAIGPGTVAVIGLSQQASFFYNANGTYAANLLPKWCANAHTTTAVAPVTATNASPAVFTWAGGTGMAFGNGSVFELSAGTPPAGFSLNTQYYVVAANQGAGTFELSATLNGSPLNSTSTGSGLSGYSPGGQNAGLLQSVGAQCARVDVMNWDQIEQSTDVYNWAANSDPLWNAICGAGITPIFVATYNNPVYGASTWAQLISGSTEMAGYSNYIVAGVNELVNVNHCTKVIVEGFNEPNLTQWTGTVWTGQAYASVMAPAAAAAKAAQPGVTFVTGGASPGVGTEPPQAWLGGVVGAGISVANFGGYGLHPYAYNEGTPSLTPLPASQLIEDVQAFARVGASGIGQATAKPIYITEYGFSLQAFGAAPTTCASPSTCQTQGIYMAYAMLTAVALFTPMFTQYDLIDDGISYSATDQNTFGMFYNPAASSGNPVTGATPYGIKPQGTAFKSVAGCTAGTTSFFLDDGVKLGYSVSLNVETEVFNKPSGACLAIFTWDASSTKSYSVNIGSNYSSVSCKDVLGNSVSCTYAGGVLSVPSVSEAAGPVIATASY